VRWPFGKRGKKRQVVIPRAPEPRRKRAFEFSGAEGLLAGDAELLVANEHRINLAYRLGLNIALSRAGSGDHWLLPDQSPPETSGYVVVHNADA
jgi:hypothetical protein